MKYVEIKPGGRIRDTNLEGSNLIPFVLVAESEALASAVVCRIMMLRTAIFVLIPR